MASTKDDTSYMTGKLLLAMPSMTDSRFERAVIFICAHDEGGAMGLVINNTMPDVDFSKLVGQLKFESDIKVKFEDIDLPVMSGGPVDTARGFLLHSSDFMRNETMRVDGLYGVTGTVDALKDVAVGNGPKDMLFVLGYAGWSAGQLDSELQQNAWLVVDADPSLIFEESPEDKWTRAIDKLGVDPGMLSSFAGQA